MNVLLVDDHTLFVSGLKNLLEAGGVTVAGTAKNGVEALAAARDLTPDLILMDIHMAGGDGLSATRRILAENPEIKIVMLSMNDDDEPLFQALKSGASGYLLKNLDTDTLFTCLEQAMQGEMVFSPGLAQRAVRELCQPPGRQSTTGNGTLKAPSLTSRQEEVLRHVARGKTYKTVAKALNISEATVKFHMKQILERLHLKNRTQAIMYMAKSELEGI
jgi:two-component system NarL family response regulator